MTTNDASLDFGAGGRLKGVVSMPESGVESDAAVVFVSAGFTSRNGPYRIYAEMARRLGALGVPSIRFDLGGIGNSQTLHPAKPLEERTCEDIHDAIDAVLNLTGLSRVVVGGLCSGGEDALLYAERDDRVAGVFLVDPHAYRTAGWYFRNVFSRLFFNRIVYKCLRVTKLVRIAPSCGRKSEVEGFEGDLIDYQWMERSRVRRILSQLMARGTRVHYIYTGGRVDDFNHRRQFFRMFDGIRFNDLATVDWIPHIEHLQMYAEDRAVLYDVLQKRLGGAY